MSTIALIIIAIAGFFALVFIGGICVILGKSDNLWREICDRHTPRPAHIHDTPTQEAS